MPKVGRDGRLRHRHGVLRRRARLVADHNPILRFIPIARHHGYDAGTDHSGAKQEDKQ